MPSSSSPGTRPRAPHGRANSQRRLPSSAYGTELQRRKHPHKYGHPLNCQPAGTHLARCTRELRPRHVYITFPGPVVAESGRVAGFAATTAVDGRHPWRRSRGCQASPFRCWPKNALTLPYAYLACPGGPMRSNECAPPQWSPALLGPCCVPAHLPSWLPVHAARRRRSPHGQAWLADNRP